MSDPKTSEISCETALATLIGLDECATLGTAAQTQLESHLAGCESCREFQNELPRISRSLQEAYGKAQVSASFSARVMATLPSAATRNASSAPRVYTTTARGWLTGWRRAAAMAAVLTLTVLGVAWRTPHRAPQTDVLKGCLLDGAGNEVRTLRSGEDYRVTQTAVLELTKQQRIKAEPESNLRVKYDDAQAPEVVLQSGDIYAASCAAPVPLRVTCADFVADLRSGDVFVSQESAPARQAVVIVFEGSAEVTPTQRAPVSLLSGEIFVSDGAAGRAHEQTLQMTELSELEAQAREATETSPADLRARYAALVQAYRRELSELRSQVTVAPLGSPQLADLSDRQQRIEQYLEAHQRRLDLLNGADRGIPFEQLKRGMTGHTEPGKWL